MTFAIGFILLLVTTNFIGNITLPLEVIGHEGSTVLVILSGLRLLRGCPPASLRQLHDAILHPLIKNPSSPTLGDRLPQSRWIGHRNSSQIINPHIR